MQAFFAKIVAFFMSILAFFGLVKPTTNPTGPEQFEGNCIATVIEQDIEFQLKANATTGYEWQYLIEGDAAKLKEKHYEVYEHEQGMVGVGGVQYFTFTAVKPGKATVTFNYARSFEKGSIKVFIFEITVADDMTVTYKEVE